MPSDPRSVFCAALLTWLQREAHAQGESLALLHQLGEALISGNPAAVEEREEALRLWEDGHRPLVQQGVLLERQWRTLTEEPAMTVSGVVAHLQAMGDPDDFAWRLGAAQGALREVLTRVQAQAELNALLVAQHAEVLQQTYVLLAHAMQGTHPDPGLYAPAGTTALAPASALLDARG